jgi:hypothetical protein
MALDVEEYGPTFDDEKELIGVAIINYGYVCSFDNARKEVSSHGTKAAFAPIMTTSVRKSL